MEIPLLADCLNHGDAGRNRATRRRVGERESARDYLSELLSVRLNFRAPNKARV